MTRQLLVLARSLIALCILCSALVMANENEGIIVVAHTDETIELSRSEVRNLFLGGAVKNLTPIDLPSENLTRVYFNTKIIGLTEARIQGYWAQMRFSGRRLKPQQVQTEVDAIEFLLNNKGAVTYLPLGTDLPEGLSVVYRSN